MFDLGTDWGALESKEISGMLRGVSSMAVGLATEAHAELSEATALTSLQAACFIKILDDLRQRRIAENDALVNIAMLTGSMQSAASLLVIARELKVA